MTNIVITAYCCCSLCCGQWSIGPQQRTASGTIPTEGRTAASNFLPLGTRFLYKGHVYVVEDRMSSKLKGKRIDIYVASHERAKKLGVRHETICISKEKSALHRSGRRIPLSAPNGSNKGNASKTRCISKEKK